MNYSATLKFAVVVLLVVLIGLSFKSIQASPTEAHLRQNQFSDINQTTELLESSDITDATIQHQTLVLGLGCFWGAEKRFEALPGVINVLSGYADGRGLKPTYREITKLKQKFNDDNFAEVIRIEYNQSAITTDTLIKLFYEMHDPTQKNRQGNDIGTQYRSTILYNSKQQADIATRLTATFQQRLNDKGKGLIQTQIKPLDKFYPAEDYHQDYIAKNPNGYCPDHSTGVTFEDSPLLAKKMTAPPAKVDNSNLLIGKQIVVIDAPNCPYCERFKEDVTNDYAGDIPLHFRLASQLDGLTISSPTFGTPTILFMEDGKERLGHMGYMTADSFYKALGAFKLGDTEAYKVAFGKGTDNRFCKAYDKFKNTPPGVFIDSLSGAPLFDTSDRFNSGTGWLSFHRAVEGSVTYHEDNSFGMERTEVRAKITGIHLGHVFNDGPNGGKRYCINATVLDFVPRT
ncbi:peptide-methionine (S)-S-oxide reductase MsrA [Psychrosphaera sp.]|nr:peptide-methionine (S)-S-oxide reductase MsrA [Psychrosphaera sp.]